MKTFCTTEEQFKEFSKGKQWISWSTAAIAYNYAITMEEL